MAIKPTSRTLLSDALAALDGDEIRLAVALNRETDRRHGGGSGMIIRWRDIDQRTRETREIAAAVTEWAIVTGRARPVRRGRD